MYLSDKDNLNMDSPIYVKYEILIHNIHTLEQSNSELVSGFSASGVAPAYNFVESLPSRPVGEKTRKYMYEHSTSKQVQFAMQKSRALSLLLAMLGDLSVMTSVGIHAFPGGTYDHVCHASGRVGIGKVRKAFPHGPLGRQRDSRGDPARASESLSNPVVFVSSPMRPCPVPMCPSHDPRAPRHES